MIRTEILETWALAYVATLIAYMARITYLLFGVADQPPDDPRARQLWRRKRVWLIVAEGGSLPFFATGWTFAAEVWALGTPIVVLGSMASGALGFAFTLDAVRRLAGRRLGLENLQ